MIQLVIKHKTKQRLVKAVNVFVQFTFVVYSVGFGFLAAPMQANAASTPIIGEAEDTAGLVTTTDTKQLAPAAETVTTDATCPTGDVHAYVSATGPLVYDLGHYDGSATITGNATTAHWAVSPGYTISKVCIKIDGPDGGSLITNLDPPAVGTYTKDQYDIISIVLYTDLTPYTNPRLANSCGLDIALVIDSSGSIDTGELLDMKNAYHAFVNALLPATPTQFGVVEFDTNVVTPTLSFTNIATTVNDRIDDAESEGWTNWADALEETSRLPFKNRTNPDLVIFASDGNPNTIDINAPAYNAGHYSDTTATNAAMVYSEQIKAAGIRILSVGIGDGLDIENLKAISGPNVNTGNILTSDVITTSFTTLAADLAKVATTLCGGTITVTKNVDGTPAAGWEFSADVTDGTVDPVSGTTTGTEGQVTFDISDIGANGATASITETTQNGFALNDASCSDQNKHEVGTFNPQTHSVDGIPVSQQDIISCTFNNLTQKGDLTVIKHVVGGTAQASNWTMNINNGVGSFPGSETGTQKTVTPGIYTVTESGGPSGYTLTYSGDCNAQGVVSVASNEDKTCTLTNTRDTGDLTIVKQDQNQQRMPGVVFSVDGTQYTTDSNGTIVVPAPVYTGEHTVLETSPDGYTFSSVTGTNCTNSNPSIATVVTEGTTCTFTNTRNTATITFDKVVLGGGPAMDQDWTFTIDGQAGSWKDGQSVALPTGTGPYTVHESSAYDAQYTLTGASGACSLVKGEIKLNVGDENATCTVTNARKTGTITVNKKFDDNGDGQIDRTNPGTWTWDVVGGTQNNAGGATLTLPTGPYTLTEDTIADYNSSWTCTDTTSGNGVSIATTLGASQDLTCTFTNTRKTGNVTFEKVVATGTANPSAWTFTIDGIVGTFNHGQRISLPTGDYTVTEHGPAGYSKTGASGICGALTAPTLSAAFTPIMEGTAIMHVTEDGGTCTFTNERDTGTITVLKNVDMDGDGDIDVFGATDWSWNITNGQQNIATGQVVEVETGAYTITENQKPGYHVTNVTCNDNNFGASISADIMVNKDQNVTCSFINTRDTGTVTFNKVIPGYPDAKTLFEFRADGRIFHDNESGTFQTGEYTVTENDVEGYSFDSASGICEYDEKTHDITMNVTADGGTCIITNTRDIGTISGVKFNDLNGNGVRDAGEPGVANVTINANNGMSTTTDGTGAFAFMNVPTGQYAVSEVVPAGWIATTPASVNVTVVKNETASVAFGNFKLGTITGMKFNDVNGDGQGDDEDGLKNWTIQLWVCNPLVLDTNSDSDFGLDDATRFTMAYKTGDVSGSDANGNGIIDTADLKCAKDAYSDGILNPIASTLTDEDGEYSFNDLGPGTYFITEVQQDGWQQTAPASGYHQVQLTSGANITDKDFGNFQLGRISGYKYDTQENWLNGWEICLMPVVGQQDDLALTSISESEDNCVITGSGEWPDGYYEFTDLFAGMYTVQETQQSGWKQVSPNDPGTYTVEVTSGTGYGESELYDFVNRQLFPDLTISKDDGLAQAEPGATLTYAITVTNNGEYDAHGVFILDTLPAHVTYVSDTSGVSVNQSGTTLMWDFPALTLAAGESMSFDLTVKIDDIMPTGTTTLTNAIVVSTESVESDLTNNSASDTTTVAAAPIISIAKSDSPDPVEAGALLTYTIDWDVMGNAVATNVTIVDTLDANTSFVSASNSGAYDASTHMVTWNLGDITPLANGSLTLVVRVASPLTNATELVNTVVMDSSENTPVNDDEPTTVTSAPELTITKDVSQVAANPGNKITYTIIVSNLASANAIAKDVTISDTLPNGFTLASDDKGVYNVNVGDLAPGESESVSFDVIIGKGVTAGAYTNTGIGDADNSEPVDDDAVITVVVPKVLGVDTSAQLTINKTVDKEVINPRGLLLYSVTVTNVGDETATNVTVTDNLPQGFTFVADGAVTKVYAIGDLEPNHSRTITYQVRVAEDAKAGTYTNLAVATADNASKIADQADVEVRPGRVLAATGAGTLEYAMGILATLLLALGFAGIARYAQKRREDELQKTA
ncbi:MAG: SdrD B-like domain-containing protein [Patescibacteria group bacterium]